MTGGIFDLVDKFKIHKLESISSLTSSKLDKQHARLESLISRLLTETELSAVESMESEHASYASSGWYLKNWLPINGINHIKSIGDEAAAVLFYVKPKTDTNAQQSFVLVYSSESHNGPSYVCAHPGAATGEGGRERDDCAQTGDKPNASIESRRQGDPRNNSHNDPIKQHTDETTRGIADYANAMGIPHHDGAIKYHTGFTGNNLVNVFGTSVTNKNRLLSNQVPTTDSPDKFVGIYVGKASDATGIGGTKFASQAIDMNNVDLNEKAVQDPDPHLQETVMRGIERVINVAIDEKWVEYLSLKDMGAAGLLCSSLEQLHDNIGVVINGDLIPQNEPRTSLELLEAETQERFFFYVHENYAERVLKIFNEEIGLPYINKGACAAIVGRCNDSGNYTFVRTGVVDVDLPVHSMTNVPAIPKKIAEPIRKKQIVPKDLRSLEEKLDIMLNSINFKSDEYIYSHYDQHIGDTNIVIRGDACASLRTHESFEGKVAYSTSFDSNVVYGLLDPKFQAEDSFLRGAWDMATVGCSVIGVTNNANYGRTDVPREMWEFVKGQEGVANICRNWQLENSYLEMISHDSDIIAKMEKDDRRHVTVNSGNCSLNKANANTGTAIPPTTILGLTGWTNTPSQYATWDLKDGETKLYLIGARQESLDGTDFLQETQSPNVIGNELFSVDYEKNQKEVTAIISAVRSGYISAANTIKEGGLFNAVSKMIANTENSVDVQLDLRKSMGERDLSSEQKLFSESYGIVMQITSENEESFLTHMKSQNISVYEIGNTETNYATGEFNILKENDFQIQLNQNVIKEKYHTKLEKVLEESA